MRAVSFGLILAAAILLAGCSEAPQDENQADPTGSPAASPSPVPDEGNASTPPSRELVNTSYRFPRAGSGADAEDSFDVPAEALMLDLRYRPVRECPAGYYENPRILIEAPNGTQFELRRFEDAGSGGEPNIYNCPSMASTLPGDESNRTVPAIEGTWSLQTAEECTCSVEFAAISDP